MIKKDRVNRNKIRNKTKWKKNGKKILVLFLVLGFIGGTMNPVTLNAATEKAEGEENPKVINGESEEETPEVIDGEAKEESGKPDENETEAAEAEGSVKESEEIPAETEETAIAAENETEDITEAPEEAVITAATDEQIEAAREAMTAAMVNWDTEVDLSGYNLTADDMGRIWPDVAQDNPDLFYVLDYMYFTSPDGLVQKCQFTYNTQYDQDSVLEYRAAIDKVFAEVIEDNMTDEQKATALHDYLIQHMVYDQNANNNLGIEKRNAYEALVNGIGVCQGYTLAYAALLKKAGIEVDYCKSKSMNHIWNYVKLNGKWYHADLTYDDATAASQVGETGYVKHTYFLLSDTAMRGASHEWEANDITCSDTSYDNSWHKTAPLNESAIYTVNGASYYLKGSTVAGAPTTIYNGASLIRRESGGTESIVGSFEIENLGNGWPMYQTSFSRLSCSRGVLYFNVGNSVYSFDPSKDTVPVRIYQYEDADKRIVTGLLAEGDTMTLEIYNTGTNKIDEKINVPVPKAPEEETIYKIEIENGISEVPDSFKDKEHLNTPEKIEQEMKQKLQEKASGIEAADIAVYDVELLVNVNGAGWQEVTKDGFPSDGLSVTLPYPSDTGKETHDFTAAHMFTADMNGFQAGDIEYPDVTKTEDGITFKVYGLSPIAVGWQEAKNDSAGDNDGDNDSGNGGDDSDNDNDSGNGGDSDNDNDTGNSGGSDNDNNTGNGGGSDSDNSGDGGSSDNNNSGNTGNNADGNGNNGNGVNNANGNSNNGNGSNSNGGNGGVQVRSAAEVPVTGDDSPVIPYLLLAAAALGIMSVGYRQIRKKCWEGEAVKRR